LIQGESGVGKEMFAKAFHASGARAEKPFVALNCAAIPEHLIESELFGYIGGAFTGALKQGALGKIAQASSGTLFLDEIGDMPLTLQVPLLRVLQERTVVPLGGVEALPVDISLVCATHHHLQDAVFEGRFREDLYYRINGLTVTLPPLRERSDILALAQQMLESAAHGRRLVISDRVKRIFEQHDWPGNLRQLNNAIRVAVALLDEDEHEIQQAHLPEELFDADSFDASYGARAPRPPTGDLRTMTRSAIEQALETTGGNISAAARLLGISRNTLYRKLDSDTITGRRR
jgi:transcriptional regulator with PAS, ATPase and Fis domain